jgi:hypothetical protein
MGEPRKEAEEKEDPQEDQAVEGAEVNTGPYA